MENTIEILVVDGIRYLIRIIIIELLELLERMELESQHCIRFLVLIREEIMVKLY
jgi:hypothetical protein